MFFLAGVGSGLAALADTEHLGAANGADSLGCGLAVFHSDGLGVLHVPFGPALYAVSFHCLPSFFLICQG